MKTINISSQQLARLADMLRKEIKLAEKKGYDAPQEIVELYQLVLKNI